ncbi:MAG: sugar phosphate isomerase/epimerase [Clostridia bacterium]|nr:sugar phosphate isomerase/epimerase [Clostridia bacterium]
MNSFKIGLASVTFRQKTIEEIVALCEKAGVDCIEWGSDVHVKTAEDAKKAKTLCDKAGIEISSYGSYYRVGAKKNEEWLTLCENAKIMGAKSIRVWLGEKDSEKTSDRTYRKLLEGTEKICTVAENYGLLVCPECHDHTFNNNTQAFLKLKNDLNKPNFKTYFQSRYFRMEYDLDRIEKTYEFIENVHVSYFDQMREQLTKEKNENYLDTLLNKFKERNFSGAVILEFCESDESFFEDILKLKSF